LALNRTGKIQSDLWLAASVDQVLISAAPGTGSALLQELQRMLIMEDAEIEHEPSWSWVTVHGAKAPSVAIQLVDCLPARAHGELALLAPGDFVLATQAQEGLLSKDAGATLGSEADWHALRIEHGLPQFGVDYDSRANPHDASLERRAISWSKGCYLGQEVVCMQDMRGKAKHRMLPLKVAREVEVAVGTTVCDEAGQPLGEVTSTAHSGRLGCPVVLARMGMTAAGIPLFVDGKPAQRLGP
jgi:folate-binding protein YgfZ